MQACHTRLSSHYPETEGASVRQRDSSLTKEPLDGKRMQHPVRPDLEGKDHVISAMAKEKAQVMMGRFVPETASAESNRKLNEPGSGAQRERVP